MSNRISRDSIRRKNVSAFEIKRKILKGISQDRNISLSTRYQYSVSLSKLPRNSSKTRVRNRCVITGRARSVYRRFRISRILFRELASNGSLPGVLKASW
jgi:ribosomal protein S14